MNSPGQIETLSSEVTTFLGSLDLRLIEGTLFLDRPAPRKPYAASALRGLLGHLLKDANERTALDLFKPQDSSSPAFLIQFPEPVDSKSSPEFRFRIITWDRGGHLLDSLIRQTPLVSGRPFGPARAKSLAFEPAESIIFSPFQAFSARFRIRLNSPLCLRRRVRGGNKTALPPHQLTLPILIRSIANRLIALAPYGQYAPPTLDSFLYLCHDLPSLPVDRLNTASIDRRSSTQRRSVPLRGILGETGPVELSETMQNLFAIAELLHLGLHTAEGCGHIQINPECP